MGTRMVRCLFIALASVVAMVVAWSALVTFFSPPLTLGWREFYEAMIRRWPRNAAVIGVGAAVVFVLWVLLLALRRSLLAS